MQAARNFRSRAIGGPSRSRPGNGLCGKAGYKNHFFPRTGKKRFLLCSADRFNLHIQKRIKKIS
jgi:hypothetical protein